MFVPLVIVGVVMVFVLVQWQRGQLFSNRDERYGGDSGAGGTGDSSDADCADSGGDGGGDGGGGGGGD